MKWERDGESAPDQVLIGVNNVAAPIFDHRGQIVASIAVVGSAQHIDAEGLAAQVAEVTVCARTLSHKLAWRP